MADSSFEPPRDNNGDVLELNNDLERMIENMEQISVQLTWMAYDMVVLRTNPELAASARRLQEAYQRCRAVVCGDKEPKMDPNPMCCCSASTCCDLLSLMENNGKGTEPTTSASCINLENVLQELGVLSKCMDQLAVRTQLRLCDLIVCVGHPDKSKNRWSSSSSSSSSNPPNKS